MREIKFRAWDKKFHVMIPDVAVFDNENICIPDVTVNELYGDKLDERLDSLSGDIPEWYSMTGGFVLMQYTGLKDKNGKEIYENDVVEFVGGSCHYLASGIYDYQKHCIGAKLVVQYLKSGFNLRLPVHLKNDIPNIVGNVHQYDFWNHAKSLIVIGNMYENPELLK